MSPIMAALVPLSRHTLLEERHRVLNIPNESPLCQLTLTNIFKLDSIELS